MTTTADLDTAASVLAAVRTDRRAADEAEARILQRAADWAALHEVSSVDGASVWEHGEQVAGEGAPLVAEFCIAELAAALGLSTDAGRRYVGAAVELRHRLPRVHARVVSGDLPAWRARRLAETTMRLSAEAASYLDRHLAPYAHKIGPVQAQRLVDEALARFKSEEAEARRAAAAEQRHLDVHLATADTSGTVWVEGTLDLADAIDLEAAVSATARQLAELGSRDDVHARRAQALGEIARRDLTLDLTPVTADGTARPRRAVRRVVLHVHLTDRALAGDDTVARCEDTATPVLVDQVREWCATAGSVVVRPVLDLAGHEPVDSYEIPDRHRAQVELRDHHCAFPWCARPASRCDLDHLVPHAVDGITCPCNLASC